MSHSHFSVNEFNFDTLACHKAYLGLICYEELRPNMLEFEQVCTQFWVSNNESGNTEYSDLDSVHNIFRMKVSKLKEAYH